MTSPIRTALLLILALVAGLTACPAAEDAKPPAEPYLAGRIRIADKALKVAPTVGHTPQMDLFIQCKIDAEKRTEAGAADTNPCYDPTPRATFTTVRVEHHEGMTGGKAMGLLRPTNEGTHFIVDQTGSLYQTLDLAYAVRRAGAVRPDEVRVLSGNTDAHETLVAALKTLQPTLKVEVVEAPAAVPPKAPAAPPAPAKEPPDAP